MFSPSPDQPADLRGHMFMLLAAIGLGLVFVVVQWPPHVGTALLWAAGCLAPGFLLGFLFGIPSVLQQGEATDKSKPQLGMNTNLNQIGDWLTKMLVGVTLVQLAKLPELIWQASGFIGRGIGGTGYESLAGAILLYFSATGFLSGYIWAVLHFSKDFRQAVTENAGLSSPAARTIRETPLEVADPRTTAENVVKPLQGEAAAVAPKLASLPLEQIPNDANALETWARVQFDQRQFDKAVAGYQKALTLSPNDARLRYRHAIALRYAGGTRADVTTQLRQAAQTVLPSDAQLLAEIVNSLTFNDLYLSPPDSYEMAIKDGLKYVAQLPVEFTGAIWVNLACAYGQKARRSQLVGEPEMVFLQTRDSALDAVRKAVRIDPRWRTRLAQLLDPSEEDMRAGENDLVVFRNDADFRQELHLPPAE